MIKGRTSDAPGTLLAEPPGRVAALAWTAEGENLIPIPGTKRCTYLEQNAAALDVELTDEDLARIDTEMPEAAGACCDEHSMATVNL